MTAAGSRNPWLLSLALHGVAAAVVLGFLLAPAPPVPQAVRMHLVSTGSGAGTPKKTASQAGWGPPARAAASAPSEPGVPAWRTATPSHGLESLPVPAPVSLDELLGGAPVAAAEVQPPAQPAGGWSSSGGEGYEPPPLPPPGLAPPQGAQWTLVLSVPGGGGFATHVEGLDSGHPELDHWLETYLRTISFPSSLDGQDYRLKWTLHLETGRPR